MQISRSKQIFIFSGLLPFSDGPEGAAGISRQTP
jgi:hypothetical protein